MTNNYFKVYHYIPMMELRLDERTMLFFFDDTDVESIEQALHSAEVCRTTIGTLTYGRRAQLSVYRRLCERGDIEEIGTFFAIATTPAA